MFHPYCDSLLSRLWSKPATKFWTFVGTLVAAAGTVFTWQQLEEQYRQSEKQEARLSEDLREAVADRLRRAAADGVISSVERHAFESWVDARPIDQERIAAFRATLEQSLVEAARSGIAGAKLVAEGKLPAALIELQRAERHDPGNLDVLVNLGGVLLDLGDPEGAEERLRTALTRIDAERTVSDRPSPYLGEEEMARAAISLRQAEFLSHYNLAACLAAQRPPRASEAVQELRLAMSLVADEPLPGLPLSVIRQDLQSSRHFAALASDEGYRQTLSLPLWASDSRGSP